MRYTEEDKAYAAHSRPMKPLLLVTQGRGASSLTSGALCECQHLQGEACMQSGSCFPSERGLNGTSQIYHMPPDLGFLLLAFLLTSTWNDKPLRQRERSGGPCTDAAVIPPGEKDAHARAPSPSRWAPPSRLCRLSLELQQDAQNVLNEPRELVPAALIWYLPAP